MLKHIYLFVLILSITPYLALAEDETVQLLEPTTELSVGTLNIIIVNDNEIVAATDSRSTPGPNDNNQKLFHITEHIGCTVAGLGAASLSEDARLGISASGIINRYISEIQGKGYEPQIQEVADQLAFSFKFYLSSYTNALLRKKVSFNPTDYMMDLVVFGYEDNKPRIIQKKLWPRLRGGIIIIDDIPQEPINYRSLKIGLAGRWSYAIDVLKDADKYLDCSAIDKLLKNKPLQTEDLISLIDYIMVGTSKCDSSVGGRTQLAVLKNGTVDQWDKTEYPRYPSPILISVASRGYIQGGIDPIKTDGVFIFINFHFKNVAQTIDYNYFSSCTFDNCNMLYFGGPYIIDSTNRFKNCSLHLKQDIVNDDETHSLIKSVSWQEMYPIGPLLPQTIKH